MTDKSDDLRDHVEWLACSAGGISGVKWNEISNAILEAADALEAKDAEIAELREDRDGWRSLAHDAAHKLEHMIPMLGPRAREVLKRWSKKNIKYMHVDYGPKGIKTEGEERAQLHLDFLQAMEDGELIEDVDSQALKAERN